MAQDRKKQQDMGAAQGKGRTVEPPALGDAKSSIPSPASPQTAPQGAAASRAAPKPPPTPQSQPKAPAGAGVSRAPPSPAAPAEPPAASLLDESAPVRRIARRRPSGPVRGQIAANDDGPSLGGLLHSLEQKPSQAAFTYAAIAGAIWAALGCAFAWSMFAAEAGQGADTMSILARPTTFLLFTAIAVPIAVMWFLALLSSRADELRLRSSTMTEVAVRLAQPDSMAEQSVASLGQAVRRQVSFMNDAVSRALGRAGELEALVHNQVAELEHSYEENERRIRGLIDELSGERSALLDTSDKVTLSLRTLGDEVPTLIEKLSTQQVKLAEIISGAGTNLNNLESAITQSVGRLENTLGSKTEHLQHVLTEYTEAVGGAIGNRTDEMQTMLEAYKGGLDTSLGGRAEQLQTMLANHAESLAASLGGRAEEMRTMLSSHTDDLVSALGGRTHNLQAVFEEFARALDTTLANRAQALDVQLVDRTRSLDAAFSERLRLFDDSILRSTMAIDSAVGEKSRALTTALDHHAKAFSETVGRQAGELDETLMHGINSVRRSSENITRQSLKAIEGLAGQSDLLKNVSENLLSQINSVTNRFDAQGQSILMAASALDSANYKIDSTLQDRHNDLKQTLERLSGKADEFGQFVQGYSSSIEGSLSEAELRARAAAEEMRVQTENRQRAAFAELERMKAVTGAEGDRALEDLRRRFSNVSTEVTTQFSNLGARFDETSAEVRQRAARTTAELAEQETRLREQMDRLPAASRENSEAIRRALGDQLKALEQLSQFAARSAAGRDVMPPLSGGALTSAYANDSGALENAPPDAMRGLNPFPGGPSAPPRPPADARGDSWSLGDLLARASRDEDTHQHAGQQHTGQRAPAEPQFFLDTAAIARALDGPTAAAVWSRIRNGQRGAMVRSIYSPEGRVTFDEVSRRCKTDAGLQDTIQRYLLDFERILADAERTDPSGRAVQAQLMSETGRVYLFLAHASGRLG